MTRTIPACLHEHADTRPDRPAYAEHRDGAWRVTTWRTYKNQVRRVARALIALGVGPGAKVAILGFNRSEWPLMALGAMAVRGVAVGVYTTCSPQQVRYVVDHAEARVLLIEDLGQWAKVEAERDRLPPTLRQVVLMRGAAAPEDPLALGWDAFLARADEVDDEQLDARLAAIEPGDLASLIYTSGTTGVPKGVMLDHANLVATARILRAAFPYRAEGSSLSYLPLAHIAEQMLSIHLAVDVGYTVYFARAPETVPEDLRAVEPTYFFGVPRVWERFHAVLTARLGAAGGARRALVAWATGVGRKVAAVRNAGRRPGPLLAAQARAADRLVLAKVRALLGFGRLQLAASGAAPIARDILTFMSGLGVIVHEIYGLSETTGPGTWNRPGLTRFGTVGTALVDVEVRIADDGEVLLRGPNIFRGYLKSPQLSAEALDQDGWFHSGDLGALDGDGYLTITGRKKEIIITSGGKNIAPASIEQQLKQIALVADAVVIGNDRRFLSALIGLEGEAAARFAEARGVAPESLPQNAELLAALQAEIDTVNAQLSRVEHVRAFRVLPRNLSVADGELTPTLKVKRDVVDAHFADLIEAIYA